MKGIDVSAWQEEIGWEKVKAAGIEFAILKLGQYRRLDEMFETHLSNAKIAGMKIGIYYYATAKTIEEATADAEWTAAKIAQYFNGIHPEMGIWYDVEDHSMEGSALTEICRTYCETLKTMGYHYAGIYSSYSWLTDLIDTANLDVPYWVAQYYHECNFSHPNLKIWQYTNHFSDELPYDGNVTL